MDLATKIRLMFISESWETAEFALAWVFSDPKTHRSIQVSKDLTQIDLISAPTKRLFSRNENGRYARPEGSPVRADEMFRLLRYFVKDLPPVIDLDRIEDQEKPKKKVSFA